MLLLGSLFFPKNFSPSLPAPAARVLPSNQGPAARCEVLRERRCFSQLKRENEGARDLQTSAPGFRFSPVTALPGRVAARARRGEHSETGVPLQVPAFCPGCQSHSAARSFASQALTGCPLPRLFPSETLLGCRPIHTYLKVSHIGYNRPYI